MAKLQAWGWSEAWQTAWETARLDGAVPGRILSQREDTFTVVTEDGTRLAHPAGVLFHRCAEQERPAVGDWVALEVGEDGGALVTHVLARRSRFLREAPGGRGVAQLVATNVDTVFIVSPVSELNLNRLERFLVAICAGGAEPTVVLSKGDLVTAEQLLAAATQVRALMDEVSVLCTSAPRENPEAVREEFRPLLLLGSTYALVGASGAGKSTLLNALVGQELQATGQVREGDGKGRHVTSFRQLFALPNGALMMDTPGMREFALWADDGGLERVFSDIVGWAESCRFSNCTHHAEPGCQVQSALADGRLSQRRLDNWRVLDSEMLDNVSRRSVMQARRERGDLRRKKKRDTRFSGR